MTEGLNQRLERIEELLEEQQDSKKEKEKFKIPFHKKVKGGKLKKNFVTVVKLNDNGGINFYREKIEDSAIVVDAIPRIVTEDNIFYLKKNPVVILPSWTTKPLSKVKSYEKAVEEKMTTQGYRLLLNAMKTQVIKAKRNLNFGLIILGIVVVGGIIYYLIAG